MRNASRKPRVMKSTVRLPLALNPRRFVPGLGVDCVVPRLSAPRCPLRVISGKARSEQMTSGLPPKADLPLGSVETPAQPAILRAMPLTLRPTRLSNDPNAQDWNVYDGGTEP